MKHISFGSIEAVLFWFVIELLLLVRASMLFKAIVKF